MRATFAYFTASVSGNETASSVIIKAAQIGTITYKNGDIVSLDGTALPGDSATLKFSISSDTDSTDGVNYAIKWADVTNGFVNQDDLVYTLTGTGNTESGTLASVAEQTKAPATGTQTTIGTGKVMPNETHEYTLTLHYKETGSEQNSDQGKSFTGKVNISTGDNEYYYNASNKTGTTEKPSAETE